MSLPMTLILVPSVPLLLCMLQSARSLLCRELWGTFHKGSGEVRSAMHSPASGDGRGCRAWDFCPSQNHSTAWVRWDLEDDVVSTSCYEQGCQPLNWVLHEMAWGSIQSALPPHLLGREAFGVKHCPPGAALHGVMACVVQQSFGPAAQRVLQPAPALPKFPTWRIGEKRKHTLRFCITEEEMGVHLCFPPLLFHLYHCQKWSPCVADPAEAVTSPPVDTAQFCSYSSPVLPPVKHC